MTLNLINNLNYDNNGNQTTDETWTNTWDYNNRLVSSTNGISTSTYSYDQAGQRVKKTENGVVSIYPNRYYTIENGTIKKHIFAGDIELASVEGTTTTYHHVDHLSGSSVETDEEGYVTEVLDYYPFGATRLDEKYTTYENDKKFTGHEYDADTGLYYMNARYQNPEVGRFISQDPLHISVGQNLANPQSLNSYSYVENNPLKYIDPTGKDAEIFIREGGLLTGLYSSLSLRLKNQFGHVMIRVNDTYYGFAPTSDPENDVQKYTRSDFEDKYNKNLFTKVQLNTTEKQDKAISDYYESFENKQTEGGENEYDFLTNNCTQKAQDALSDADVFVENMGNTKPALTPNELLSRLKTYSVAESFESLFNKSYSRTIEGFNKERVKKDKK